MLNEGQVLLAGDIGGTKTLLAVYRPEDGPRNPLHQATFPSRDFLSLDDLVATFLRDHPWRIGRASFGIAGPVVAGRVEATNLPWVIEERIMSERLQAPVRLLNDLLAIAHAVPHLTRDDVETINSGKIAEGGPRAVVAPGTGLGEAFLIWSQGRYLPFASEGGHADFAPNSPLEEELLRYLRPHYGHVSYERVCSGRAIPDLYRFLKETGRYPEPAWLAAELNQEADPTRVIVKAGVEGRSAICRATLGLFADILAAEAGNLALKVLATGGVYLGGGLPPRLLRFIKQDAFRAAFLNKGRLSGLLAKVPVYLIRHPEVALFGAACHGLEAEGHHG